METTIAGILIPPIITLALGAGIAWFAKPHPLRGKTILVGMRPTTGRALIRAVNAVRGTYTWKERGDFKADIDLDSAFLWQERSLGVNLVEVDLDTMQPVHYEGTAKALIEAGKVAGPLAHSGKETDLYIPQTRKERLDIMLQKDPAGKKATTDPEESFPLAGAAEPIRYEGVCITDAETVEIDYFGQPRKLKNVWKRLSGVRMYLIRKDIRAKQLATGRTTLEEILGKFAPWLLIIVAVMVFVILIAVLKRH